VSLPAWLRNPRTVDIALTLLVGAIVVPGVIASADEDGRAIAPAALLGVLTVLPLLVRRRAPFATLGVIVGFALIPPTDGAYGLPLMVALYTIGSTRSWEATAAAAASVLAIGGIYRVTGGPEFADGDLLGLALECVLGSLVGLYVGSRRARAAAQREGALAEERLRIAHELHDVVAHNVSLIVVQAQALGATVDDERVREATDGIADLGRQAMTEMHRTLKLLRGDDRAELAPQPGLGELPELLERARTAGVGVDLAVEGQPRELAQSVDLSAYRIVQEALTNVVKHAGRAHATVTLGYRPDALELTIADSGEGGASPADPGGHGLIGMRERAAMFGGTLTAGPRDGRGFEVHASLPYGGAS
jgi:signal transduction histidine kinase